MVGAMKTVLDFAKARQKGRAISVITAYDTPSAKLVEDSPVDAVLVGDSLAMVVHGHDSTVHATNAMMALHTAAVRRGTSKFIIADLPFLAHRKGLPAAMRAVDALMKAGANAVKLEGARGHLDLVRHIVDSGVPVMGHLGLTPQSIHALGGHRVQGREAEAAARLREDALGLQAAGCFGLVLELVPAELSREITEALDIPTIGIGCGAGTSGQVLVWHDALGLNPDFRPKFLRTFANGHAELSQGLARYAEAVEQGDYPSADESF